MNEKELNDFFILKELIVGSIINRNNLLI
jgi:hypothetical protein